MEARKPSVEFHLDGVRLPDSIRSRIRRRVDKWMKGHKDITGASIAVREQSGDRTAHAFTARVVLYHRPENIAATSKGAKSDEAVLSALDAAERQLRETREKLRERWKRPGASTGRPDTTS